MSDTYVPGFSHALQRYATGGAVNPFPTANTSNVPPDVDLSAWTRSAFAKPTYSDATQQYLNSVLAYAQSMKPQYGSYYSDIPLARQIATPVANIPMYASEAELQQYLTRPPEQNVAYTFNLPSNGRSGKTGDVNVRYDTPIILVDNRTGQVVASGTGFDAANQVIAKARDFTSTLRGKSNWSIYTGPPGATDPSQFVRVARDDPAKGVLGTIADIALPALGAVALGPLGAAVGSGLSGVAQGRSLGDVLKGAALSGALTAGFGQIMGPVSAGAGSAASGTASGLASGTASGLASGAASGLAASIPGQIVVQGIKSGIAPALVGALSGAAAGVGSGILSGSQSIANKLPQLQNGQTPGQTGANGPITVVANTGGGALSPAQIAAAVGAGGLLTSPATLPSTPAPQTPPAENKSILDQIGELSTLDKIRRAGLGLGTIGDLFSGGGGSASPGTIPGGLNGGLNSVFTKTLPTANMPAAAPRTAQDLDYYRYGYGPQQSFFSNAPQGAANTSQAYTGYAEGGEVRDYDMEGALRAGIKPDEFGHMPDTYKLPNHMTFSEDSVYSTPEHRGGRWMEGADGHWVFWPSEHNMREHPMPEMQDYFERVEQGVPGRPDSYAVYPSDYRLPERKAQGGSPFAVGGPGDGRDDKIPAMLSDGEYVMDAETVALLGNGSSKAGAKMLDKFRVNVRKQKGRKLAKGEFSDNAKAPEHYLKGRK